MRLETSQLREIALELSMESIKECSPEILVGQFFEKASGKSVEPFLQSDSKVYLLSIGKAALPMARAAIAAIGKDRVEGLVVTRKGSNHDQFPPSVNVVESGHPTPNENSFLAGRQALETIQGLGEDVPVLFLVSGGASSLFEAPVDGIGLEELKVLTDTLLRSGVSIKEFNTVRKALSKVKGGKLRKAAGSRACLTLILSDVVGDSPESVGSGPTIPVLVNVAEEAIELLKANGLWTATDQRIRKVLEREQRSWTKDGELLESFVETVGNNRVLCMKMIDKLKERGFNTIFLGSTISGEACEAGRLMADIAREIAVSGNPLPAPAAIVSGGETVVRIKEDTDGLGGPNQEFALSFCVHGAGLRNTVLLSMDTDGIDGPTDFAGGLVDGKTFDRIKAKGINPKVELERHNSTAALEAGTDLLQTGKMDNNLNDLRVLLVGTKE